MTVQEYLSQAFNIDNQINSKLTQISSLRELATKTNTPLSDMPGSPNCKTDKIEKAVIKMVDLENEINDMIDQLVDLKIELTHAIYEIKEMDCRTVLEMRYLCFKRWEEIAESMNYNIRRVYRLHKEGLKKIKRCQ